MNPVATLAVRLVVETCSGMVVSRALSPIVKSATGLTKVAMWIGVFGLNSVASAYAGKVVVDSINDGLKLGDEITEKTED